MALIHIMHNSNNFMLILHTSVLITLLTTQNTLLQKTLRASKNSSTLYTSSGSMKKELSVRFDITVGVFSSVVDITLVLKF